MHPMTKRLLPINKCWIVKYVMMTNKLTIWEKEKTSPWLEQNTFLTQCSTNSHIINKEWGLTIVQLSSFPPPVSSSSSFLLSLILFPHISFSLCIGMSNDLFPSTSGIWHFQNWVPWMKKANATWEQLVAHPPIANRSPC